MALVALAAGPMAPAWAEPQEGVEDPTQEQAPVPPPAKQIPYEVEVKGIGDSALLTLIKSSSQLESLKSKPPATLGGLRRRAEEDRKRLDSALRSEGYYGGQIEIQIEDQGTPVKVVVEIDPGPRFDLGAYKIIYPDQRTPDLKQPPALKDLGIELGMPARASAIVTAQGRLLGLLQDQGYPRAQVTDRKTTVDFETRAMTVTVTVDPGPLAYFGPAQFDGLEDVEADHVQKLVTWTPGEIYDRKKLESTRRALVDTRLFSGVSLRPAAQFDAEGRLPIIVSLSEGAMRSIGFGASYSTDVGVGGEAFWSHRNFFGRNEEIEFAINLAEIEQSGEVAFRKPLFLRNDQALVASAKIGNEDTDAFTALGIESFVGLEREFPPNWKGSAGVSLEFEEVDDNDGTSTFLILGLPVTAQRDRTDNLLNPSEGSRLDLTVVPYGVTIDDSFTFLRSELQGRAYHAIDEDKRFILAGRAKVGSIVGPSTSRLPADKRFYAGGGGSIRGYAFQLVGPLDSDNDPLGGRSLLEMSAELRVKVTDNIGLVPFVDGGTVYDNTYPDFEETIRWAAGLGLRYFTGVGPVRLDVAVPLNRRRDVDDAFQFYISFGQAF